MDVRHSAAERRRGGMGKSLGREAWETGVDVRHGCEAWLYEIVGKFGQDAWPRRMLEEISRTPICRDTGSTDVRHRVGETPSYTSQDNGVKPQCGFWLYVISQQLTPFTDPACKRYHFQPGLTACQGHGSLAEMKAIVSSPLYQSDTAMRHDSVPVWCVDSHVT
jgi:hypothetical protein